MKKFSSLVSEVAEPLGGDEIAFKAKHVVQFWDYPEAEESQFSGDIDDEDDELEDMDDDGVYDRPMGARPVDLTHGEDEAVYENYYADSQHAKLPTETLEKRRRAHQSEADKYHDQAMYRSSTMTKADREKWDHHRTTVSSIDKVLLARKQSKNESLKESADRETLKKIHADNVSLSGKSTAEILKHHKNLRRVQGSYTAAEVGGKRAMIGDILSDKHGRSNFQKYSDMNPAARAGLHEEDLSERDASLNAVHDAINRLRSKIKDHSRGINHPNKKVASASQAAVDLFKKKIAELEGGLREEHGDAADRGAADAYYHRIPNPHKKTNGQRDERLTPAEVKAYHAAYERAERNGDVKSMDEAADPKKLARWQRELADLNGKKSQKGLGGYTQQELDNAIQSVKDRIKKLSENAELFEATKKLNKDNVIHHDENTAVFARDYHSGHIGDYRPGGPTESDEKKSERFHNAYDRAHVKSGYAGSRTDVYTRKSDGRKFQVDRRANGNGFYGTDHHVSELKEAAHEVGDVIRYVSEYTDRSVRAVVREAFEIDGEPAYVVSGGKTVLESELQEISTLEYAGKATDSINDARRARNKADAAGDKRGAAKARETIRKRMRGQDLLAKKLFGESEEELQELSKKTLVNYVKKRSSDIEDLATKGAAHYQSGNDDEHAARLRSRANKKRPHVSKALDKLAEGAKVGQLIHHNGESTHVTPEDRDALNRLFGNLSAEHQHEMEMRMKTSPSEYRDVLKFARSI